MTDFSQKFDYYISLIDNALGDRLSRSGEMQQVVFEAMSYSISAGGKRIRPVILLEFCRMCGGRTEDAIPFACAIEMIHTYSLIHDDLPCMDNDDIRRGKPSCHKAFGEANALLAGDALLNLAFETMLSSKLENRERVIMAARAISKYSGADGMIGGQVIDLSSEGKNISQDVLIRIYKDKTSALLMASAVAGVILGGGSKEQIMSAEVFGENLGLAFQITDDVLDCIGDEDILGKPIGSDEKNDKKTYVSFYGVNAAQKKARELTSHAIDALSSFEDNDFIKELSGMLCKRNK